MTVHRLEVAADASLIKISATADVGE